jgi:hypothetical protein
MECNGFQAVWVLEAYDLLCAMWHLMRIVVCGVQYQQMDLEYTFWQMFHLCTSPKVV